MRAARGARRRSVAVAAAFPAAALIIDYVTTRPVARGRGLASLLVDFVVETSRACGANTYVLAIEESCVYWMGKDFVLEAGRPLNARLNIFPDTHLLRRVGDPDDAGDEADLDLQVEFEEGGEEGEEGGDEEEEVEQDDGGLVADLVDDDMPARMREALELKQALELSAAAAAPSPPPPAAEEEDDDEEELAAAIALSLQAPPAKRSHTADENSPPGPSAGASS